MKIILNKILYKTESNLIFLLNHSYFTVKLYVVQVQWAATKRILTVAELAWICVVSMWSKIEYGTEVGVRYITTDKIKECKSFQVWKIRLE